MVLVNRIISLRTHSVLETIWDTKKLDAEALTSGGIMLSRILDYPILGTRCLRGGNLEIFGDLQSELT